VSLVCTLAIDFQVSPEVPLVVAANRDEFLDRPSAAPRLLSADPWVVGGQDLNAGGTWFGVNEHGMVVGLLNRRSATKPDPEKRSRGLLCLETLQTRSPTEALARLGREAGAAYNGFNLLVADTAEAYVVSNPGSELTITPLGPGLHLLTNLDLNDPTCPRIAKSHRLLREIRLPRSEAGLPELLRGLRRILSDHATALDPRGSQVDTLCVHLPGYGTRSSSIVVRFAEAAEPFYWHSPGPPCRESYVRIPLPCPAPKRTAASLSPDR
jgi:uncharacterized protein with NRDE domain